MSERQSFEIIVVGGGPAGLTAALLAARRGFSTALVAPPAPADARSTALLGGSVGVIQSTGAWPRLLPRAAALRKLRIVDDTGSPFRPPELLFDAAEVGLDAFGYMVPNTDLLEVLQAQARAAASLTLFGEAAVSVVPGEASVLVRLADGAELVAELVIAADGANSMCRTAAGIATSRRAYDQHALVTNVSHRRPHEGISTEFHTDEGPFTIAPLPGDRSAIVCVVRPETAARLAALTDEALGREMTNRSHRLLGELKIDGSRASFPLRTQIAGRFGSRRIALIGEAAHVLPPIGAQGLNLGLRDASQLIDLLARRKGTDPGAPDLLNAYERLRRPDVDARSRAIDLLNRSLLSRSPLFRLGRGVGFALLDAVSPLRRIVMQEGLASSSRR